MYYETLEQALAAMDQYQQTKAAYDHAMGVLYLDATTVAPGEVWEGLGKTMEILSGITYKLETDDQVGQWLACLEAHREELLRKLDDSLEVKSTPKKKKFFDTLKDFFD